MASIFGNETKRFKRIGEDGFDVRCAIIVRKNIRYDVSIGYGDPMTKLLLFL